MSKALSVDLRERVLAELSAGASHREAAERFGVSAASVSRWRNLKIRAGHVRPGPLGGDHQSHKIKAHGDTILSRLEAKPDTTLAELGRFCGGTGWRSRRPRSTASSSAMTRRARKTGHAVKQDRPDVRIRRDD